MSEGHSTSNWGHTPSDARARSGCFFTSTPSTNASPSKSVKAPVNNDNAVVFPAPLCPRSAVISPRRAAKDMPSSARVPPNVLETFATRTAAVAAFFFLGNGSEGVGKRSRSSPSEIAATSHAKKSPRRDDSRVSSVKVSAAALSFRFRFLSSRAKTRARNAFARFSAFEGVAPTSTAHASAPYASAFASVMTSTPPAEKVPEAASEASSSASRLRNSVSHLAPLCAFSSMATAQPHMYTPLAGIIAVHASHALDPSGLAAAAAMPGVQVSTYASAPATAATLASRKHAERKKQNAASCADQTQRNAKVTVQSVCLNGYDPIADTRKDTNASDA